MLVVMGVANKQAVDRAELGKALAQAGHKPVKLEIIKAKFGGGAQTKDVTAILRHNAEKLSRDLFPRQKRTTRVSAVIRPTGTVKQLKVKYRIDGKDGELSLNENAPVVLPMSRSGKVPV